MELVNRHLRPHRRSDETGPAPVGAGAKARGAGRNASSRRHDRRAAGPPETRMYDPATCESGSGNSRREGGRRGDGRVAPGDRRRARAGDAPVADPGATADRRGAAGPPHRPPTGGGAKEGDGRAAVAYAGPSRGFEIDLDEFADELGDCTEHSDCNTGECRIKVLPTFYRITRVIADSEDLANALSIILEVMQRRMRIVRGMVSLLDRRSGTIFIHRNPARGPSRLRDGGIAVSDSKS